MRHFGIGLAGLGGHGDKQPVGVIRQLRDQPPFVERKFAAGGPAPRRLAVVAHVGKPQRQHAPQHRLGARMRSQKLVGAVDQHAAKLKTLRRQP